ncbi:MAG: HAD family hydrolase, partial [Campylobacterota bacterium]|nr:HAD family hydrolase [Campylobacterota bacterium]
ILYRILKKNSTPINKKLEAISLYMLNINRLTDYENIYKKFIDTLNISYIKEKESKESLTTIYIGFYLRVLKTFGTGSTKQDVINLKNSCFQYYNSKHYLFLDNEKFNVILNLNIDINIDEYNEILNILSNKYTSKKICLKRKQYNRKIIFIDLDGTLTNTAHSKFKQMKDGIIETNLSKIPLFDGAKEFIDYQKSINNTVVIVSDSHFKYVEKISRKIFNVNCISLCDKPNIVKIRKLIDKNDFLKKNYQEDKNNFIFIGDTWLDIATGRKLNIPTILIELYKTSNLEIRDGIGDRLKHIKMGPTYNVNSFKRLKEVINNPKDNLLTLEGIFNDSIINTSNITIKDYVQNHKHTRIVALARQQQGECDNYTVTKEYFNISNFNRTKLFIDRLSKGIENYIKTLNINSYDIITYVTDKITTKPVNKMKEIFDAININIKKDILFEWSKDVQGSLRDRSNKSERNIFVQNFLFVKESLNLKKKNIIIIDDQITTGSTAEVLIEQLRKKGVENILFIGLFMLISNIESEKRCPNCGKNLLIKIKRNDGSKFFSCTLPRYGGNGCGYTENMQQ